MKNNVCKPTILIDTKKSLIRIHKKTLYMLGNPAYIELLINPQTLYVAVRTSEIKTKFSHKINWNMLCGKNSYEIISKVLIARLINICETLQIKGSYKIIGNYSSDENIACFDLKKAFEISGDDYE